MARRSSQSPPTMISLTESLGDLEESGYVLLRGVLGSTEIETLSDRLTAALRDRSDPSVLRSRGRLYGSRNLMETFPEVCDVPRHPSLKEFVVAVLGSKAGMVRALYFDKPPDRSWSLPWHRDRTIAVERNDIPTNQFRKPTVKAGIPHVEAPESLLEKMLTLRIHVDPMTPENGPLSVIPGSHLADQQRELPPLTLSAEAGDVLAMRPLLSHSSSVSQVGTMMHRRIIHLELAPYVELPDGFQWYAFNPINES